LTRRFFRRCLSRVSKESDELFELALKQLPRYLEALDKQSVDLRDYVFVVWNAREEAGFGLAVAERVRLDGLGEEEAAAQIKEALQTPGPAFVAAMRAAAEVFELLNALVIGGDPNALPGIRAWFEKPIDKGTIRALLLAYDTATPRLLKVAKKAGHGGLPRPN
jgi:hypothetical protein